MTIKFEDVGYVYDPRTPFEKRALEGVSFEMRKGESLAILGKTGSGKSTILRLMNGILKPSSGNVSVDGISTSAKDESIFTVRRRVGLVFQYPDHQFFEENVFKEIAFGPRNFGAGEPEVRERVLKSVEMVGFGTDILQKSPFLLSGGEKRKVAIASVIACEPEYLVFDEPTSALDPMSARNFFSMMAKFGMEKRTVVVVTHSVEEAISHFRRIIVVSGGRIVFDGDGDSLMNSEDIERWGLLPPPLRRLSRLLKERGRGGENDGMLSNIREIVERNKGCDRNR